VSGVLDEAADPEIPGGGIEPWHFAVVKHGPLEGERLAGREAALRPHLALEHGALVPAVNVVVESHGPRQGYRA